MEENKNKHPQR